MLKYSLRENLLTADPDDCMAQVQDVRSYSQDEVIDLMMRRGTTLTRADVAAVLQVYTEVVGELTADGSAVNTPLFNTSFSVSGVFTSISDSFDKARHTVSVNINAGTALREAVKSVRTEKTEGTNTDPYITEAADVVSGAVNFTLTAGGILRLTGSRLKFDAADTAQGVFLVPETGGEAVRCSVVAENKPARVMVMIPADIAPGAYYAEVRTKLDSSRQPGKRLKTGRYGRPLTVAGGE
ncbi:MAG: DUF4469 domain-containing protein [Treponemataceae bacterium]|nr:DUF4469 domain-containing protein [Treponemataceae bacterium]MDE7390933.1 DUF4469 domain-containing protein [Treponemataceae bacterium]